MIKNYGLIQSMDEFRDIMAKFLADGTAVGIDIETGYDGPDKLDAAKHPEEGFIVGISFTNSLDWARYVPLRHDYEDNFDNKAVAELLWPVLRAGLAVPHNASFELKFLTPWLLEYLGPDVVGDGVFKVLSDTMIEAAVLSEWRRNGLKDLVEVIFGHRMKHFVELFPGAAETRNPYLRFNVLSLDPDNVDYACEDALWALALHLRNYPQVKDSFIYKLEMEVLPIVVAMETYGVCFDWKFLRDLSADAKEFMDIQYANIQDTFSRMLGEPVSVNLASPKQVQNLLYDRLGFSTTRFTKSTQDSNDPKMSTDTKALETLAREHPAVRQLLEYREVKKLVGSYTDKFERDYGYDPLREGVVHPSHNQVFVISGRFSVAKPNYQQLIGGNFEYKEGPLKGKKMTRYVSGDAVLEYCFRDCVTVPDGYYAVGFDYGQAELRALAGEANETALLQAFADGIDPHIVTAALILSKAIEEIDKLDRAKGKAQPMDSNILTPTGYRRFGDIQVGDLVVGSDGHPTEVTGVFPQGSKDCYEVETSDGVVECCDEHLWTVRNTNTHNRQIWKTKSLRQLMQAGIRQGTTAKYELPARPVIQFEKSSSLPMDPYVLGALLGDGGFTGEWCASFGSADKELLDAVMSEHESLGGRVACLKEQSPGFQVFYLASGEKYAPNRMTSILRDLGLWGHRDRDKFIPKKYLLASPEDRLALLQGLLDTDGNAQASGAQFRVTSLALSEGVQFLARSLGGFASCKLGSPRVPNQGFSGPSPQPVYSVYIRIPGVKLFRVARKADKQKEATRGLSLHIKKVTPIGQKEMQCIAVSNSDGLYISDNFSITHNTSNFAILYGQGVKAMAESLGISFDEAKDLWDKYFEAYPAIRNFVKSKVAFSRKNGYAVTKFGRKMTIWEYQDARKFMLSKADRMAVNTVIQGSATGDVPKIAMVRSVKVIKEAGYADRIHLVMNVHDALEFYVHKSVPLQTVIDLLEPAVVFDVPGWPQIVADWHTWERWGSCTDLVKDINGKWVEKS